MENGPHEEAKFPEQEPVNDEELELPSVHTPEEELEEPADDEDKLGQPKRRRHDKGDSASGSSPAKRAAAAEVADTGSCSPSAKESNDPHKPLTVDPLGAAPPMDFSRLPSVSLSSEDDEEIRLVDLCLCLLTVAISECWFFFMFFLQRSHWSGVAPEYTYAPIVEEDPLVVPDASVAATTEVARASTSAASEKLVDPTPIPTSLLEHVRFLDSNLTIGSATSAPDGSSPRDCVQPV